MLRRYGRLLVAFYVVSDALLAVCAFGLSYVVRFSLGVIPVTRGYPPFEQYVAVMPFVAVLVPLAYQFQGVYRLRRGRSRVDDFFVLFIGTIVAVVLGIVSTLYFEAYHASPELRARGAYQVSRIVWALVSDLQRRADVRTRASSSARCSSGDGRPASASSES